MEKCMLPQHMKARTMKLLSAFALSVLFSVPTVAFANPVQSYGSEGQVASRYLLRNDEWSLHASHKLSAWRSHLFMATEKYIVSMGNNDKPERWDRFRLFQPFITCPPGRPLRRVGPPGDGGKVLCEPSGLTEPCTVLSLGSNMDFRFEEAILSETRCSVLTMDCTVEGRTLSDRHQFRKLCLGSPANAESNPAFITYSKLAADLGGREIAILKIDIESWEFPVFAEWHEHTHALPEQISVEVHWTEDHGLPMLPLELRSHWGRGDFGVTDLALFFFHLANLGYGIVNQEENVDCPSCSEFTLFRVEAPSYGPASSREHAQYAQP